MLDRHFLATASVAAAAIGIGGTGSSAEAAIVYSGPQNLSVPNSNFGMYINLVTKEVDSTDPLDFATGWDFNPYVGQTSGRFRFFTTPASDLVNGGTLAGEENGAKLASGALIGPASTYTTIAAPLLATPDNAGAAWDGASAGGTDFVGVRFTEAGVNGGSTVYGWIRINKPANAVGAIIVDWAFDDAGGSINAGVVPEPASLSLLAMGAIGLLARRGKVQLRRSA
ncbi:MAG: PEP-CTERM sorting domain-containing protein [Tepidisphaeraceae bacterium]